MTFDPTKPVQTRDGRNAKIICIDFYDDNGGRTIVARVDLTGQEKKEGSFLYYSDGRTANYGAPHPCDLINIQEARWVNVYRPLDGDDSDAVGFLYETKNDADVAASGVPNRIACLEFTEGDGITPAHNADLYEGVQSMMDRDRE